MTPLLRTKAGVFHGRLLWLLATLALLSCSGDADYGDQIQDFVNGEVFGLTKDNSEAEIKKKWQDTFAAYEPATQVLATALLDELDQDRLEDAKAPDTIPVLVAQLTLISSGLDRNVRLREQLKSWQAELRHATSICEDDNLLSSVEMSDLSTQVAQRLVVPASAFKWDVQCTISSGGGSDNDTQTGQGGSTSTSTGADCWESLVNMVSGLWGFTKAEEQRQKAVAAIASIPQRVFPNAALLASSEGFCRAERDKPENVEALTRARDMTVKIEALLIAEYDEKAGIRRAMEGAAAPFLAQQVQDRTGVSKTNGELLTAINQATVERSLEQIRKEGLKLDNLARASGDCVQGISAIEDLEGFLTEASIEIRLAMASKAFAAYSSLMQPYQTSVESTLAKIPAYYLAAKGRACNG